MNEDFKEDKKRLKNGETSKLIIVGVVVVAVVAVYACKPSQQYRCPKFTTSGQQPVCLQPRASSVSWLWGWEAHRAWGY